MDNYNKVDVMWVGLSAKYIKNSKDICPPLDARTNSGKVVSLVEQQLNDLRYYKTNLVPTPPLDKNGKLRYPTNSEMNNGFISLEKELVKLKPKVVILLGEKSSSFIHNKITHSENKIISIEPHVEISIYRDMHFISVVHPSYIYIYKRRALDEYIQEVCYIIDCALKNKEAIK
ncbi:hypothetical protein COB64_01785 [Candidatus Wolfebacteria bacterium]|nr:MAG: hypothetical protein COB64_01785 [Candidatus Wolfebacteria bacterium]